MLKFCRKSKPKTRFVRVTEELDGISWESRRKNALSTVPPRAIRTPCICRCCCHAATMASAVVVTAMPLSRAVPFYSIVRVQKGPHTSTFARGKFAATAIPERSFSIICDPHITNGRVSLDLVAGSIEQRNLWYGRALCLCLSRARCDAHARVTAATQGGGFAAPAVPSASRCRRQRSQGVDAVLQASPQAEVQSDDVRPGEAAAAGAV
jgi:hypothetical protein